MPNTKKIRVLAYRPRDDGGYLMVPFNAAGFQCFQEDMAEGEPGDVYEVKFVEMTEAELKELPEHEGW